MDRIVVLGGGVGGTLAANLLARRLRLQFDYDHPPRPPKPGRIWHLGKVVFNRLYWHTVPQGRV